MTLTLSTTSRPTSAELKARVRRSLPTLPLEAIRIASPCTASWEDMQGDDRSRHCGQCSKTVHDLSAMTRAEAEALVGGPGPTPCIRMWVRHDGTVITQDCPVGLAKVRRHLRRIGAAFGALLGWVIGLTGCTRNEPGVNVGAETPTTSARVEPTTTGTRTSVPTDATPTRTTPEGTTSAVESTTPVAASDPASDPTTPTPPPRCVMGAPPPPPREK